MPWGGSGLQLDHFLGSTQDAEAFEYTIYLTPMK